MFLEVLVSTHNICLLGEIRKYVPKHSFNLELWNVDISSLILLILIHFKIFFYPFQKVQIIWPASETGPNSKPYYLSSCGHDTLKLHKPYSKLINR